MINGEELRPYQETGVEFLMEGKRKLLADDMGLGKTCMTAVALDRLGAKKVLVLCPSATVFAWQREVHGWSEFGKSTHIMQGMKAEIDPKVTVNICPWSITSSPMVAHFLKEQRWGVLVLDEIQYAKSTKANRTQVVFGKGKSKGIVHNSVYIWALSGTPMTNTPIDLWPMMSKMNKKGLGKYNTWMKFTTRYCKRYLDRRMRWNVTGAAHVDELSAAIFKSDFGLRRTKREVLPELPPKQFSILPLRENQGAKEVRWDEKIEESDYQGGLVCDGDEIATARREVGMSKIKTIFRHICDVLEFEKKVVVFCWHQDVVTEYMRLFSDAGLYPVQYNGVMSLVQKEQSLHEFVNGYAPVFVANFLSAGTGLDGLQKVCSYACFAELPWTYTELMQPSDRLDRFGQENKPFIDLFVKLKSIDQYMMKKIFAKEKTYKTLLTVEGNT